jgi:hypothetical protein
MKSFARNVGLVIALSIMSYTIPALVTHSAHAAVTTTDTVEFWWCAAFFGSANCR